MLIGLTGYARSGKDTVADILVRDHGFKRYALADGVRELALKVDPLVVSEDGCERLSWLLDAYEGWEAVKADELWADPVRRLLQSIGQGAREVLGEDVWVNALARKLQLPLRPYCTNNVVVSDIRYRNEADWIQLNGGQVWMVVRPGVGPANDHPSEKLDFEPDDFVINMTTLPILAAQIGGMLR